VYCSFAMVSAPSMASWPWARVVVGEPHLDARGVEKGPVGCGSRILESRSLLARRDRAVHLQRRACPGDLHRKAPHNREVGSVYRARHELTAMVT